MRFFRVGWVLVTVENSQAVDALKAVESPPLALARPDHMLTVNLEDYFQVAAFQHLITRDQWYRFETRLQKNTEATLQLLDEIGSKATFFVLGWIADKFPELVRSVSDAGHEVASRGFYYRDVGQLTREEFREDLAQAREAIEAATGQKVLGYRISENWLTPKQLWALDVLKQEGHEYDSSILPCFRQFCSEADSSVAEHETPDGPIWKVPLSSRSIAGLRIPVAGGNYFRQLPAGFIRNSVKRQLASDQPFVLYFHTWELDADQPRINAAGSLAQVRHYRNLDRVAPLIREFTVDRNFGPVADYLHLDRTAAPISNRTDDAERIVSSRRRNPGRESNARHHRCAVLQRRENNPVSRKHAPKRRADTEPKLRTALRPG